MKSLHSQDLSAMRVRLAGGEATLRRRRGLLIAALSHLTALRGGKRDASDEP